MEGDRWTLGVERAAAAVVQVGNEGAEPMENEVGQGERGRGWGSRASRVSMSTCGSCAIQVHNVLSQGDPPSCPPVRLAPEVCASREYVFVCSLAVVKQPK